MGAAGSHHVHTLSSSYTHQQQQWRDERKGRRKERGGKKGRRTAGHGNGTTATEIEGLINEVKVEGGEEIERVLSPPLSIPFSQGSGGGDEGGEGGGGGGGGGGTGGGEKGEEDEKFTPSYAAYTPSSRKTHGLSYKTPELRQRHALAPPSSVSRPNIDDALRRISLILHQHVDICEGRLARLKALRRRQQQRRRQAQAEEREKRRQHYLHLQPHQHRHQQLQQQQQDEDEDEDEEEEIKMFDRTKMRLFAEEEFVSPQYLYRFVRVPIARPGICYSMKQVKPHYHLPALDEIYHFLRTLFKKAALSSECAIVCLIYVERLMQVAHIPLVAITWRPIVLCGLLLASKVWQDLSSWNVEFSQIFPHFSLQSINRLERLFINQLKWDLYISSSLYAKYYFALRSLYENKDVRRRYNTFFIKPSLHTARKPPPPPPPPSLPGAVPKADEISLRTGVVADDLRDMFSKSV
ncbi:cyclin-y-like protein [Nannochloropsis oceanica]